MFSFYKWKSEFPQYLNMSTCFQTFTPSYENISNRINRLRHNSASHSTPSIIRNNPQSIPKNINLFTVETPIQPKRRISPTPIIFTDDKFLDGGKTTGRVTKNVGLKKYNQRQLKQVMQCKLPVPPRNQGVEHYRLKTEASPKQSILASRKQKMLNWQRTDEIKINEQKQPPKSYSFQKKLIPGKLYKRSYLSSLLRQ